MPNWAHPLFDWDEGNEEHILERHGIEREEVESVFRSGVLVRRRAQGYIVTGQSLGGRFLFVVCVIRDNRVRPISARPMTPEERSSHEKRKPRR